MKILSLHIQLHQVSNQGKELTSEKKLCNCMANFKARSDIDDVHQAWFK